MKFTQTLLPLALALLAAATSITACHFHDQDYYCINTDGVEGSVSPAPTGTTIASFTGCHLHGALTYCMNGNAEVLFVPAASTSSGSAGSVTSVLATTTAASSSVQTTEVTGCHAHGTVYYCIDGSGAEGLVSPSPALNPALLTDCHAHATETYCVDDTGAEYKFAVEVYDSTSDEAVEMDCHFHAGVEHCVPVGGGHSEVLCERVDRDYDIPLRVGLLFAVLAACVVAALGPIYMRKFLNVNLEGYIFVLLSQFGTGVIISTAFVHLLTHAFMMFSSSCIHLKYEGTTAAIAMAGLFVSFLIHFVFAKILQGRKQKTLALQESDDAKASVSSASEVTPPATIPDRVSVMMLEAGIIFHSVLIGITLVVAGDSYFITLFIVIIFHQFFEGIALGTRIAELQDVSLLIKTAMGMAFAITTPVGMAIGIGVLNTFNGNDPSTIIALGTLDSFLAGILLWVGLVEMLAHDWLEGMFLTAGALKIGVGMFGLLAGMILMSVLGKWA